ncbi:MAG: hypothetical protein JW803_01305 [Endomicrobiales bacterium]|nr:hypothetical protein [Endomicrobiales bacterium]
MADLRRYQLANLVDMNTPAAVFEEVKCNFVRYYDICEFEDVRRTFGDFNDLFEGKYPGYKACNTKYHDKIHTTDALVSVSRLMDGYMVKTGHKIPVQKVKLALIATILHDTGYIQTTGDKKGTGAKYTLFHVERSIDFLRKYFRERGYSRSDFLSASKMINCTGLGNKLDKMRFTSKWDKLLGHMLGASDLLGQMASRTYLERLIYLYREFKEGHVKGYDSEFTLLKKTLGFYEMTKKRLREVLHNVDNYALYHFRKRYRINMNLYHVSMNRQIGYLNDILKSKPKSFRARLRRSI